MKNLSSKPRILFISTRETNYTRNQVIIRALNRLSSLDVIGRTNRPASLIWQSCVLALQAMPKIVTGNYDLIFAGFFGHLLVILIRIFTRQKILFDAFVSTYDTLIEDRKIGGKKSALAWISKLVDKTSCTLADNIILDTEYHVDYFVNNYFLPREKFFAIPVGCNEDFFFPRQRNPKNNETQVLFYCSYLPLHGVEVVVRSAAHIRDLPIRLTIVGSGPTYGSVARIADKLNLPHLRLVKDLPIDEIAEMINQSDICLGGHFGTTEKAGRVVPGKIYQILAMERPVIVGATPANMQLFEHGKTALICPQGDDKALAKAIEMLHNNPQLREKIAAGGRQLFLEKFSETVITEQLNAIINKMMQ